MTLARQGYFSLKSRDKLDFGFDTTRTIAEAQMADWEGIADKPVPHAQRAARGAGTERREARSRAQGKAPLQRAAGLATADYILANRIPKPAQTLIRLMPARLGARVLAGAIAKHAWTFAGTGAFAIAARAPLVFEIGRNPLAVEGRSPSCTWHAGVFERLFARLVWPGGVRVRETACCGCGDPACRFELTRA
jgi:divinyl protochlorophyllide a 8-vinyl-reductase